jgi:hypothetical protein
VLLVLLKTNQYNTNTIGRKTAKDKELKNILFSAIMNVKRG